MIGTDNFQGLCADGACGTEKGDAFFLLHNWYVGKDKILREKKNKGGFGDGRKDVDWAEVATLRLREEMLLGFY